MERGVVNTAGWGVGRAVLLCFAITLLFCALKNYVIYAIQGAAACEYLCPSVFGGRQSDLPDALYSFYGYQVWLEDLLQFRFDGHWNDPNRFFSYLIVAPVIEECIYRGPLFLSRRYSKTVGWWVCACLLAALFAFSHDRSGLLLLPPMVLGLASSWLIMTSGRMWPSISLHWLNNLYFLSILLYQSMFFGD